MAVYYSSRAEAPEQFTWNLKDLFESDEAWLAEYEALKALPEELAASAVTSATMPRPCFAGCVSATRSSCASAGSTAMPAARAIRTPARRNTRTSAAGPWA